MIARLLFGSVAWFAALLLLTVAIGSSRHSGVIPGLGASALARSLNRQVSTVPPIPAGTVKPRRVRRDSWTVTRASSTFDFMSVDVEAERVDDAREIANQIVTPVRARYSEILIYVRKAGAHVDAPARRVQWTRDRGLGEMLKIR